MWHGSSRQEIENAIVEEEQETLSIVLRLIAAATAVLQVTLNPLPHIYLSWMPLASQWGIQVACTEHRPCCSLPLRGSGRGACVSSWR